jgi:PKD repeat protein
MNYPISSLAARNVSTGFLFSHYGGVMTFLGGLFKGLAALVTSALALGLFSVSAGPTATFTMTPPGNPVMGQVVQFSDTSAGSPTSWSWTFGDGQTSTQQSPTHVYAGTGPFSVTLTASNASGSSQQTQSAVVSANDTLRLNASHPFTVTLTATNQHNGNAVSAGLAIPQNDLFGYFSLPGATGDPNNAEVFVKILDGRGINGQFWVFVGHVTDLIYDLTVTEVATGHSKTYHKEAGDQKGRSDTDGFNVTPTPTSSPTPTPTPTPPSSSTRIVNVAQSGYTSFTDTVSGSSATSIRVGDTVKWVFFDSTMQHSATSGTCTGTGYYTSTCTPDAVFDSGLLSSGQNSSHTFTTAGTFKYYCMTHLGDMTGTVVVHP